ncbi:MAG: DUF2922 domain-containing protein [Tissierellia bacterium]|nr:DUF2922 domain-containing protein [Tissierellia bacterium]
MNRKLTMVFLDSLEDNYRMELKNPKADLNRVDLRTAMDQIIESNVFHNKGNALTEVVKAYITETTIHEII